MADETVTYSALVRYMPYVGVALLAVGTVSWVTLWFVGQGDAMAILAGLGTLFYAGKEVGIPIALAAGGHPVLVATYIFIADAAFTCFVYPPVHFAMHRWMASPGWFGRYLRHVRGDAERHRGLVAKYRSWGLFAFMLIPFAVNGPLVGAFLGRIMGLRARQIVPTLMAAIAFTTVAWTVIYTVGFAYARRFDSNLPLYLAGAILALVILNGVATLISARGAADTEQPTPSDAPRP